jgi:hypothetical protein
MSEENRPSTAELLGVDFEPGLLDPVDAPASEPHQPPTPLAPVKRKRGRPPKVDASLLPAVAPPAEEPGSELTDEEKKIIREDPVNAWTDPKMMVKYVNKTRKMPVEEVSRGIAQTSIPVVIWKLREKALRGDYQGCRAMEIWLNWATKAMNAPRRGNEKNEDNSAAAAFTAREPSKEE